MYFFLFSVCIVNCYDSKPPCINIEKTKKQFIYSYSSEGTGYSDIQRLYNTDSTVKSQAFFYRPSLQMTAVDIQCKIKKTILESIGDKMHVCFEIMQPDVKIVNGLLPVEAAMILKEMTTPVFSDMTIAGNILSVKMDKAVSYLTAGIVKNILSNTQVVLPAERKKSWQVIEENTVGLFKANYETVNQGKDSVEYTKTNAGYEKITSGKKGQKLLPDSKTTIVTSTSGTVQKIQTSESLVTLFGADTIVASGSSVEYQLLSVSNIGQKDISAFEQLEHSGKYMKSVALSDPISDEEINRLAYKNTLADDNFETLMAKLQSMNIYNKDYEADLVKKFRALAWLSESDCIKMAAMLKHAAFGSDIFRIISHALAAVETAFSINQLATIVAARGNDEAVMTELLPVLATSVTPTGEAADVVKKLAFSKNTNAFIATTAQLALGGMIKNLMHTDKKKADELTNVVVENMKDSQDTLQQLLVYGNTGAYRLLPIFSFYISNPSVSIEIRKAAVFATRFIDHKEATFLLNNLVLDKDPVLSKAAKETITFRNEFLQQNF